MSVEGPIEPPLRLSDLAEVDSPEVVKAALTRFRRRALVWTIWLVVAVLAALLLLPTLNRDRNDLRLQFLRAPGEATGAILHQGPYDATILNVVRLNKVQYGVHLVVIDRSLESGLQQLIYTGPLPGNKPPGGFSNETVDGRSTEVSYVGRAGDPVVVIPLVVMSAEILHMPMKDIPPLRFDLRKVGVLPVAPWTWR